MPKTEKAKEQSEKVKEQAEKTKTAEKITLKEFEEKVIQLAEKGLTAEKIGESLRKQGIHSKEYGKISRILKQKNLYIQPDIKNIQAKLDRVTQHKEKHAQDKRAMRERERIFSLLRKQKAYHKVA
jgi:ribosomal protein S15P/S13E